MPTTFAPHILPNTVSWPMSAADIRLGMILKARGDLTPMPDDNSGAFMMFLAIAVMAIIVGVAFV